MPPTLRNPNTLANLFSRPATNYQPIPPSEPARRRPWNAEARCRSPEPARWPGTIQALHTSAPARDREAPHPPLSPPNLTSPFTIPHSDTHPPHPPYSSYSPRPPNYNPDPPPLHPAPAPPQPQRDCGPEPKVGLRHEGLPWVHPQQTPNPNVGCVPKPIQPIYPPPRTPRAHQKPHTTSPRPFAPARPFPPLTSHFPPRTSHLAPRTSHFSLPPPGAIAGLVTPQAHWLPRSSHPCTIECSPLVGIVVMSDETESV
jgi:hypothetical protein